MYLKWFLSFVFFDVLYNQGSVSGVLFWKWTRFSMPDPASDFLSGLISNNKYKRIILSIAVWRAASGMFLEMWQNHKQLSKRYRLVWCFNGVGGERRLIGRPEIWKLRRSHPPQNNIHYYAFIGVQWKNVLCVAPPCFLQQPRMDKPHNGHSGYTGQACGGHCCNVRMVVKCLFHIYILLDCGWKTGPYNDFRAFLNYCDAPEVFNPPARPVPAVTRTVSKTHTQSAPQMHHICTNSLIITTFRHDCTAFWFVREGSATVLTESAPSNFN